MKCDKLNLFTAIRTGGQIVIAGNGIEPIIQSLSSYTTVTGLFARQFSMSTLKYAQEPNANVKANSHKILLRRNNTKNIWSNQLKKKQMRIKT